MGPGGVSLHAGLNDLIGRAYEVEYYQVTGGPAWAQSEHYDFQAKTAAEADSHQIRAMLQSLLADRFQLKLHRETRMVAGYILSVDKGGPKLPPAKTDMPEGSDGVLQMGGGIWSRGATIRDLAVGLTIELGQPVIDDTKITGNYDFRLRFDDDRGRAGLPPPGAGADPPTPGLGSVFTVLREIGLKLESRKVPIEMLVVDSAQRPSEN
jgi:uncharacterized protein (TIGR03435 family)